VAALWGHKDATVTRAVYLHEIEDAAQRQCAGTHRRRVRLRVQGLIVVARVVAVAVIS
jgi:hypothetical protein